MLLYSIITKLIYSSRLPHKTSTYSSSVGRCSENHSGRPIQGQIHPRETYVSLTRRSQGGRLRQRLAGTYLSNVFTGYVSTPDNPLQGLFASLRAELPVQRRPPLRVAYRARGGDGSRLDRKVYPRVSHRVPIDIGHQRIQPFVLGRVAGALVDRDIVERQIRCRRRGGVGYDLEELLHSVDVHGQRIVPGRVAHGPPRSRDAQ